MPNNHIIIGLGGTGGKVILAFRKILWEEERNLEGRVWDEKEQRWSQPVANLGYLYVDSNDAELNKSDGLWQSLGQSLALQEAEKLLVGDANISTTLQNLKQYPGISGWIGDPDVLRPMIQSSNSPEGANQIRRFGRYLFARSISAFEEQIKKLVQALTKAGTNDVTFHLCCTLGCGTGSGTVVDAISRIRKLYDNAGTHRIFLYCLITDEHVPRDVGFFYPNQYAALAEINALRQFLWKPHDLLPPTDAEQRLEGVKEHFKVCYLISPCNEKGMTADKSDQEQMIAAYIYHKTIALRGITPECLQKAEDFEDIKAHPDKDRCSKFGSLGIKRFRIPEDEIRDKLSYTFSLQAVLQSLFNNWSEHGYLNVPRNRDLPEFVQDLAKHEAWYLTDDHLKLYKDLFLSGNKKWQMPPADFRNSITDKKGSLLKFKNAERKDRQVWLAEMLKFGSAFFNQNFRDQGVVRYFDTKSPAVSNYVGEIRKRIEMDLFERWRQGDDSIGDSERIVDALVSYLQRRKGALMEQIPQELRKQQHAAERMKEAESQFRNVGLLSQWMTSKESQLLDAYTSALIDNYTSETETIACRFAAEQMIPQLLTQLAEFRTNLTKVSAMFAKLRMEFDEEIAARIPSGASLDYHKKEVRLVAPSEIDATIQALRVDLKTQTEQCLTVRNTVAATLGLASEEHTFSSMATKVGQGKLKDYILRTCDQSGDKAHTNLFGKPVEGLRRILGRNIIEKLFEDYGGSIESLTPHIKTLVASSGAYLRINKDEKQPLAGGSPTMPQRRLFVFIPKAKAPNPAIAKDFDEFREKVKKAFQQASPPEGGEVEIIDTDHSPNEILLISVNFWFELRFMLPMLKLRERYENLLRRNEIESVHQVHLENHRLPIKGLLRRPGIGELPSLYPAEYTDDDFIIYMLLGSVIGYVLPEENARGIKTLQYARRDEDGMAQIGSSLVDFDTLDLVVASKRMQMTTFKAMKDDLDQRLKESYHHIDQKKVLLDKLEGLIKAKFIECGRANSNPAFLTFRAKAEDVRNLINQA